MTRPSRSSRYAKRQAERRPPDDRRFTTKHAFICYGFTVTPIVLWSIFCFFTPISSGLFEQTVVADLIANKNEYKDFASDVARGVMTQEYYWRALDSNTGIVTLSICSLLLQPFFSALVSNTNIPNGVKTRNLLFLITVAIFICILSIFISGVAPTYNHGGKYGGFADIGYRISWIILGSFSILTIYAVGRIWIIVLSIVIFGDRYLPHHLKRKG